MSGLSLHNRRLLCEALEDRRLLGVVTSISDNASDVGSLRYQILHASAGDAITFASGLAGPIKITNGILEISEPLTIQGPGAGQLTIDGTQNGSHGVFQVDAGIHNVQISGLTVTAASSYPAISNTGGYLTVDACSLTGHNGIYFDATSGGSLAVSNSIISNNTADGIYASSNSGSASVPVSITRSIISKNGRSGIWDYTGSDTLNTLIQDSVIASNSGGGIQSAGTLTVVGSTICQNGIASFRGGITNAEWNCSVRIINSTIWGNIVASGEGGGINNRGQLTLDDCTVAQNSAPSGGGIYNNDKGIAPGQVTLNNTVVANNSSGSGPDIAGTVTANYCLIGDSSGANISPTATNQIGTHGSPLDPGLAWLGGTYGGPTMPDGSAMLTAPPLTRSAAIGAGSVALIPSGITTDQRGFPRIVTLGGTVLVDMGACENQPNALYHLAFIQQPTDVTHFPHIWVPFSANYLRWASHRP